MTTVNHGHHNHSLVCIVANSPCVMPDDSAFFQPSPLATVKVHVCSTDAARLEMDKYAAAFHFGFGNLLDFDVVWSMVDCCFQKYH